MKKYFYIPFLMAFSIILLGVFFADASFLIIFDPASLLIVVGITFLLLLTHYTPAEIVTNFKLAMKSGKSSQQELKQALNFFQTMQKLIIVSGIIGTTLGSMIILDYLKKWNVLERVPNFGSGFSASILTIFYALILSAFVTVPFVGAIKKKID